MIDNHPAGWVFERGGVACLKFVDFVSLGVFLNENHVFWSNSCLNSIVFLLFCALAIKYGYFSPRKVALFWWVISQSDSGAMVLWFWHVKAVLSFAPRFGHIFQRFPAPLPRTNGLGNCTKTTEWLASQASSNCLQCLCGSLQFDVKPHFFANKFILSMANAFMPKMRYKGW